MVTRRHVVTRHDAMVNPHRPRIAAASTEYARDLAICHIESWREAYRGLVPDHVLAAFDVDRRAARWAALIASIDESAAADRTAHTIVLALDDTRAPGDRVLGFAHAGPPRDEPRVADRELYALYVRADRYGTGIAQELLRAILLPDTDTALWVFEENPRARNFYRKFGFAADEARRIEPFSLASEIRMIARRPITGRR
ncbi:GNAT family N-acetyltransferase [Nocardia elegans]|uniref:GNAT family N-acetyltransferase n=1 Tax=Nocardia elegans TaxID=300029 RepID=UPI001893F08F|nr:GNAT family N-acetyltransferase [Nocardia elegans]MBF6243240.1 GNAT family N-acetyltransferase [Nocardia elegans]